MSRRPSHLALASRPTARFTQVTAADLLNQFEVWTVLAALSATHVL